jgi:hypothetical protein
MALSLARKISRPRLSAGHKKAIDLLESPPYQ